MERALERWSGAASVREPDTPERILRAALRAFSERGFDGASTREIAAAAGVHHGLIRHHFGSKQRLWQAAVDRAFAALHEGVGAILGDPAIGSDRERMARVLRAYVHYVAENPEFARLMFEEGKRRGPRMRWLVDRHVRPLFDALRPGLERAGQVLRVRTAPHHVFYLLAGAAGAIFHQAAECRRVAGIDVFDPAVVEEQARVVEALFLGPPAEEPADAASS